jgi:DNA-binding SARP family transcriptional activator
VEFRILGPLELAADLRRLDLGGARQQIVIATLLLSANRVVTMDRLLEAIYGEDLPPTCRAQAQISISSLRRLFARHSSEAIISTYANGYVIKVEEGQLDAGRFEQLVTAARAARDSGQPDRAVAGYRDGLRLWRGPAFDGIESQLVRAAASRLDELRITTNEDRLKLELDLGRHHELVGELTELIEEYPLREQLRGHLMLALYRCDRTAEALQVYRQARRTMIDELGIEPGDRLQQLEHAILTSDPALDPPAKPVRIQPVKQAPSLLPADIADFTGRAEETERIRAHLVPADGDAARLAVPVAVVTGKGGVGKTSLAVHASHGVAQQFPDGQLFADLHGTSHPVSPMQVLHRFLRALGVPGAQIPDGLDERAEMYRNLIADQKILVVLDDALCESQVSPLLPGSGAAAVIITSRGMLAGLAGAVHFEANVFDADKSLALLSRIVGGARVAGQTKMAEAVAEYCGHLPLALRIAGARLSQRPHWTVEHLVERLADETRRLDELSHGDMGIRASISLSYDSASEQARRLFRRLALLDLPVFSGWLSAALLDQPVDSAEDVLDDLVGVQLIETTGTGTGVHSQYRFHDLIRVFARERLAAEESVAERTAALERALGALLYLAEEARSRYYGGACVQLRNDALHWPLPGRLVEQLITDPMAWYERERAALLLGVRQAAKAGFVELCWSLAFSAIALYESRIYIQDWQETQDIALAATRKAQHVRGQAAILFSIGSLHLVQQRLDSARQEFTTAADLFSATGDNQGLALVLSHIACLDRLNGRLDDATDRYEQALAILNETASQVTVAFTLRNLAQVKLELNEHDAAKALLTDALRLVQATQCGRVEAQVLHRLGETHLLTGDLASAVAAYGLALAKTRELGDSVGEAYVLQGMGVAKIRQGEFGEARGALQRSLELAGDTGERLVEAQALLGFGELALADDDPDQAGVLARQAADIFEDIGALLYAARALALLGEARAALGDADAAQAAAGEAAALRARQPPCGPNRAATRQFPNGSGIRPGQASHPGRATRAGSAADCGGAVGGGQSVGPGCASRGGENSRSGPGGVVRGSRDGDGGGGVHHHGGGCAEACGGDNSGDNEPDYPGEDIAVHFN